MIITSEEMSKRKFGKLRIKTPQSILPGSNKKTVWVCDCGREKLTVTNKVVSGHTSSCGRCKEISADEMSTRKFGKLRIKTPQNVLRGSEKKIKWMCDCGREAITQISYVIAGRTSSCGRCNEIPANELAKMKYGKLQIKTPKDTLPRSNKKTVWICDCGRETKARLNDVTNGNTTSCGRCNEISSEEIFKRKFGKLRIKIPRNILPGSNKKTEWICDCGRETTAMINHVTSGHTTACSRCNEVYANTVSDMKFGKLRIKTPQDVMPGSAKKIEWICDCGKEKFISIRKVISGRTSSCGDCHGMIDDWYFTNKERIRSLKCPILPSEVPLGGITPLEVIKSSKRRFKTNCPSCRRPWTGHWGDIRFGRALTCGCSYNRTSIEQRKIFEFIKQYDSGVQLEYKLGLFSYDIFVPSKNLLIEYDGIFYHNDEYSKEKDLRKHKLALNSGYKFMRILEQDWLKNKKDVLTRVVERLK